MYYNCKNFNQCVMWTFRNVKNKSPFHIVILQVVMFCCMCMLMFSFVFSSTCNYECQSFIVLLIFCLTFVYFVSFAHLHITTFHCIILQLHVFWWFFVWFFSFFAFSHLYSICIPSPFFLQMWVSIFFFLLVFFQLLSVYFHLFICKVLHSITFFATTS